MSKKIEIADTYDLEKELWLRKRESGEIVWKTKDGQVIPIKDMTDKHIENALAVLDKIEYYNEIAAEFMAEDWGDR